MSIPPAMQATAFSQQGIESLRGRKDPEAVRAVAREMESLFAYEMVKAMRSASDTSAAGGKGFGGEVYGTMFDMELARLLSSKGLGLQEMILKGMGHAAYSPRAGGKPESSTEADLHTHEVPDIPGETPFAPPGEGSPIRDGGRISSKFGYRKDPFTGDDKFHHGVDISADAGTEVYPVKPGEVTFSGHRQGYGNIVEIDHGDGLVTRYAHNRANRVAAGDRVGPDTVIAEVGSTGRSTGPHLHFEVQYEGRKVSPQAVFSGIAKGRG